MFVFNVVVEGEKKFRVGIRDAISFLIAIFSLFYGFKIALRSTPVDTLGWVQLGGMEFLFSFLSTAAFFVWPKKRKGGRVFFVGLFFVLFDISLRLAGQSPGLIFEFLIIFCVIVAYWIESE